MKKILVGFGIMVLLFFAVKLIRFTYVYYGSQKLEFHYVAYNSDSIFTDIDKLNDFNKNTKRQMDNELERSHMSKWDYSELKLLKDNNYSIYVARINYEITRNEIWRMQCFLADNYRVIVNGDTIQAYKKIEKKYDIDYNVKKGIYNYSSN